MNAVATLTDEAGSQWPQWRRALSLESDPSSIPVREIEPRSFPTKSTANSNWAGLWGEPKTQQQVELDLYRAVSKERLAGALTALVFVAGMFAMVREYRGTSLVGEWESNNGFDQTLTDSVGTRGELDKLVSQLKSKSGLGYREELAARIGELLEDWDDVPPEGVASLRSLVKFLEGHPKWRQPRLYATDNGMFGAEWSEGGKSLAVYSSPIGRARFSLQNTSGRLSGSVAWQKLETLLRDDDWLHG